MPTAPPTSRRTFLTDAGRATAVVSLAACTTGAAAPPAPVPAVPPDGAWDLSWLERLRGATDRAVFDWPTLGDPADPIVLELAERYLDNCAAAYGAHPYTARAVLNARTQGVPAALVDDLWARYRLGAEYGVQDPVTKAPAVRNPFWHRAPAPAPGITLPTLGDLLARGAFLLVCDFALGHLSERLAKKGDRSADAVHAELRAGFVPHAYAVPSGVFGLARAQNSGCAYVRM